MPHYFQLGKKRIAFAMNSRLKIQNTSLKLGLFKMKQLHENYMEQAIEEFWEEYNRDPTYDEEMILNAG